MRDSQAVLAAMVLQCAMFTAHSSAQTLKAIHNFSGSPDGASPYSGVSVGPGNLLYGITRDGGSLACSHGCGTAFVLIPPSSSGGAWTEYSYQFPGGAGGADPNGITAGGNAFYGTTYLGGSTADPTAGTVFELKIVNGVASAEVIYAFAGVPDGAVPTAGIVIDSHGVLYGTTTTGGTSTACPGGCGTVFSLTPPATAGAPWKENVLLNFSSADGSSPSSVVISPNGVLYGIAQGGTYNSGLVYSLTPPATPGAPWTESVLYSFIGGTDGAVPNSLALAADGTLFVTTETGTGIDGTVMSLTPPTSGATWTPLVLHQFTGAPTDGWEPNSIMISGSTLYGTTAYGGTYNYGIVFSLKPPVTSGGPWTETVLHNFSKGVRGDYPTGLAMGSGGVLYGAAAGAGYVGCYGGCGTIFSLTL